MPPADDQAQPEQTVPPEPPGWWKRFTDWLGKQLKKLFERDKEEPVRPPTFTGASGAGAANVLVVLVIGLVLAVLVAVLLKALGSGSRTRALSWRCARWTPRRSRRIP